VRHGVIEVLAARIAQFLRFEREGTAVVRIDEARRFAALPMAESDATLEHVGIVARVFARGFGLRQTEQLAQFGEEQLVVRSLPPADSRRAMNVSTEGVKDGRGMSDLPFSRV